MTHPVIPGRAPMSGLHYCVMRFGVGILAVRSKDIAAVVRQVRR
jgi:hypothetical protein